MTQSNLIATGHTTIQRLTPTGGGDVLYQVSPFAPEDVQTSAGGLVMPPDFNEFTFLERGFLRFDTSAIPFGAVINLVSLSRKFAYPPVGGLDYHFKYFIGNFDLTANAETFEAGHLCFEETGASFTDPLVLDLGAVGRDRVVPGGFTSIRIVNAYNDLYPDDAYNSNGVASWDYAETELVVAWSKPPRRKWPYRVAQ